MTTATTFPRGLIVCLLAVCTFAGTIPARAQKAKSLFYMTREPKSVRSFLAQAEKIDIVLPYWYTVDSNGLVTGGPNPLVLETARQHHVPVMPRTIFTSCLRIRMQCGSSIPNFQGR
jgi:hypothetical protein